MKFEGASLVMDHEKIRFLGVSVQEFFPACSLIITMFLVAPFKTSSGLLQKFLYCMKLN